MRFLILLGFAATLGTVAWRVRNPGVIPHSYWCPTLVGGDFIPNHIAGLALRFGTPIYEAPQPPHGDFQDPVPAHGGMTSRFTYPPPVAYLVAPLSWFSRTTAWRIWLAAVVCGMTLALWLLTRLALGDIRFCLWMALSLLVFYPLWFVFINGNIAAACAILLVIALYFLISGSEIWPAFFLALATALKLYPALWVLWFAAQKRWAALWKTIAFLTAITILTAREEVYSTFLERARQYDQLVQAWWANASLFGVLAMAGVPLSAANAAGKLFGGLIVGGTLVMLRRRPTKKLALWYQCGLLSVAMVLVPNTMYEYNLIFVIPAIAAVLYDVRSGTALRGGPLALAAVSFAMMSVPTHLARDICHLSGLKEPALNVLPSKFPWLFSLFAALLWRYRQLERSSAGEPHQALEARR